MRQEERKRKLQELLTTLIIENAVKQSELKHSRFP
jgi:hypothetical protein